MANSNSQFVPVHTLSNRFEADLLMDALSREGIPALLRQFEETPYTGLFVPQRGWGRLMVSRELEPQAREIIRALVQDVRKLDLPYSSASEIDPLLWAALREANPGEIVQNAVVEYDQEEKAYIVPFLNAVIFCFPDTEAMEIEGMEGLSSDFQLHLLVLHYLLGARNESPSQKWISEKDLPSGELFFRGPHALPVKPLAKFFNADPQALERSALRLGAERANLGDLSYLFRVLPRIPLLTVFWTGDEEFEPSLHILFDQSITTHLRSLDLVFAMVNVFNRVVTDAALSAGEKVPGDE